MARLNKYEKATLEKPNDILIEDMLWYVRENKRAKDAILSSVSNNIVFVDDSYIKEKLKSVETVNQRLLASIYEARKRAKDGAFSMEQMAKISEII